MFWRFGIPTTSSIEFLLDREDVTLQDVLDDNELLQEWKGKNKKLIDFFSKPEIVTQLLNYILALHTVSLQSDPLDVETSTDAATTPDSDSPQDSIPPSPQQVDPTLTEKLLIKYPYLASEIFSADSHELLDFVLEHPPLLPNFVNSILALPAPLHPIQASYWAKILSSFLINRTKATLTLFKSIDGFIDLLLAHALVSSPMMDMVLKLVGVEELVEGRGENVVQWLSSQNLMKMLVNHLHPDYSDEIHGSAASAILDIIAISQAICHDNSRLETNPLIYELKSEALVNQIMGYMFDSSAPNSCSSLIQGTTIFVELIRRNSTEFDQVMQAQQRSLTGNITPPRAPMNLTCLVRILAANIHRFQFLLQRPRATSQMQTSVGQIAPLGQERLRICELLAELVRCAIDFSQVEDPNESLIREEEMKSHSPESTAASPMAVDSPAPPESVPSDQPTAVPTSPIDSGASNDTSTSQNSVAPDDAATTPQVDSTKDVVMDPSPAPIIDTSSSPNSDVPATAAVNPVQQTPIAPTVTPSAENVENSNTIESQPAITNDLSGPSLQASFTHQLVESKIIVTCIGLFFSLPWNNILHGIVYDMLLQILNAPPTNCKALILSVLHEGQLTKRITTAQRISDYETQKPKGVRLGYMGHITLIADEIVKIVDREDWVKTEIRELLASEDWEEFISKTLRETRERDQKPLGGSRPVSLSVDPTSYSHNTYDDDAQEELERQDNLDITTGSGVVNDQFARYLCQRVSNDLPDKFGFTDDDAEDEDDNLWASDFMASSLAKHHFQTEVFSGTSSLKTLDEDGKFQNHSSNTAADDGNGDRPAESHLTLADWSAEFQNAVRNAKNSDISGLSSNLPSFGDPHGFSDDDEGDSEEENQAVTSTGSSSN